MKPTMRFEGLRAAGATLLVVVALALTGCGGGSGGGNSANPAPVQGPGNPTGFQYSGPAAQSPDIQLFQAEFYNNVVPRCGGCHTTGGQGSTAFADVNNINVAYNAALTVVNLQNPSLSEVVQRVGGGHNCWDVSNQACRTQMQTYVANWAAGDSDASTTVKLVVPTDRDPNGPDINGDGVGDGFRSFPADATAAGFVVGASPTSLYGLLTTHCSRCHSDTSSVKQQPFFGSADPIIAYEAIKSKIDLNDPALSNATLKAKSRLVVRLRDEFHNCWTASCANDAAAMQSAIGQLAQVSPLALLSSGAYRSMGQTLDDGIVGASGGRYEFYQIALWNFLEGEGNGAADTSGVSPAITLTLNGTEGDGGDYHWVGGGGIQFNGAVAFGNATASRKLFDKIAPVGAYSIEAWVLPSNTADEDRSIVAYSDGAATRNFMLGQTMYNYDFYNRSSATGSGGMVGGAKFSSDDSDPGVLQAALQHVVATYDSVGGRKIYVDNVLVSSAYPDDLGTLGNDWSSAYSVVIGNTLARGAPFKGALRMVAIHNRALTPDQINQNFQIKPGEKRYVMFNVSNIVGMPPSCKTGAVSNCFIYFEMSQYDNYAYLFNKPYFISLNSNISDLDGLVIRGIRIGINGQLSGTGQSYIAVNTAIDTAGGYVAGNEPGSGQLLSSLGTVVPKLTGYESDLFYLEFDQIGPNDDQTPISIPLSFVYVLDGGSAINLGWRTFDEINASFSYLTGVQVTASTGLSDSQGAVTVGRIFSGIRSQLPAVEGFSSYLSSHQTSVTQLAIAYCKALTSDTIYRQTFFGAGASVPAYLAGNNWDNLVNPLVSKFMSGGVLYDTVSFTGTTAVHDELIKLLTNSADTSRRPGLCASGSCTGNDTAILNAATVTCAAALANAAITLQ